MQTLNVLLVDDDKSELESLRESLHGKQCGDMSLHCATVVSAKEALLYLESHRVDVVVTDYQMPGIDGLDLTKAIKQRFNEVGVLLMTARSLVASAVESIKWGAHDYLIQPFPLVKPFPHQEFCRYIYEAFQVSPGFSSPSVRPPKPDDGRRKLIGESAPMRRLRNTLTNVSTSDACVLILGESGTGKELVARSIHRNSDRHQHRFIAVNCGAFPDNNLLHSQLFGNEKGAYTGAEYKRKGFFVAAGHGTLFLDEIGEIPLESQGTLLRAVEEREVTPIGSDDPVRWNARLVCATNRNLHERVEAGSFREDLYYRINVIEVVLPPLRDRLEDIPALVEQFLAEHALHTGHRQSLHADALGILQEYSWPGNVRELRNFIERASAVYRGDQIRPEHLPSQLFSPGTTPRAPPTEEFRPLESVLREHIIEALARANGVKTRAADLLGINRNRLRRLMKRHGIDFEGPGQRKGKRF